MSSIPGSGRSPGGRNGSPLQYSCLESPVDRGAWRAAIQKSCKESEPTEHTCTHSCFTAWWWFLLYSKANQPYIHMHPLFFWTLFPFRPPKGTGQSSLCCAVVLISYLFYTQQCMYVSPNLPIHLIPSSPRGIHTFVLYICVSISALHIGSPVPFLQILHICINIQYFSLSSFCMPVFRSIHVSANSTFSYVFLKQLIERQFSYHQFIH